MWITGGKLYIPVGKVVYIVLLGVFAYGRCYHRTIFAYGRCYHRTIP